MGALRPRTDFRRQCYPFSLELLLLDQPLLGAPVWNYLLCRFDRYLPDNEKGLASGEDHSWHAYSVEPIASGKLQLLLVESPEGIPVALPSAITTCSVPWAGVRADNFPFSASVLLGVGCHPEYRQVDILLLQDHGRTQEQLTAIKSKPWNDWTA